MIIIDANPLLRLILNDNKNQCEQVVKLLRKNEVLVVIQIVCEMEYVLRKVYKVDKAGICVFFDKILTIKGIIFEEKQVLLETIKLFREKNVDFVDAYLWVRAKELGTTVFTFDKDFKLF